MKINHYSIIPANVRYDRTLSDKSILLFGEISAAANAYSICDENNQYFAVALNVEPRSISRCLAQLIEQGHIQRLIENGKRRLKVVVRSLDIPQGIDIETDEVVPKEDISEFVQQFCSLWEKAVGTVIDRKEMYTEKIAKRLSSFSKDELLTALKNRATFVRNSPWHQEPQNRQTALGIDVLIKSDEAILSWLNAKVAEKKQSSIDPITPFKK